MSNRQFIGRNKPRATRRRIIPYIAGSVVASVLAFAIAGGEAIAQSREITVIGTEFRFSPQVIEVRAGEEIVLAFRNSGTLGHNLTIPALNVATDTIQSGETSKIRFVARKTGVIAIKFVCAVPGHAEAGMTGEIRLK